MLLVIVKIRSEFFPVTKGLTCNLIISNYFRRNLALHFEFLGRIRNLRPQQGQQMAGQTTKISHF